MTSQIIIGSGITINGGIIIGYTPPPILVLSLDAATYVSGSWIDTISGRTFSFPNSMSYSSDGGGSIVFDASLNQYAECPTSLSDLSTWTVEVWHYYTGENVGTTGGLGACLITEVYPGFTGNLNYSVGNNYSANILDLQSGFYDGSWQNTSTGYSLIPNNWYQIVGTYNGVSNKLYVNGMLVSKVDYEGTPISSGAGIRLMRRWDNPDYWDGKLAIVKVYNGYSDSAQVTNTFNANKARFGL